MLQVLWKMQFMQCCNSEISLLYSWRMVTKMLCILFCGVTRILSWHYKWIWLTLYCANRNLKVRNFKLKSIMVPYFSSLVCKYTWFLWEVLGNINICVFVTSWSVMWFVHSNRFKERVRLSKFKDLEYFNKTMINI